MVCYHKQEGWSNRVVHDTSQPAVKLFIKNLQGAHINSFILKDPTGTVQVISCDCVPGDKDWIKTGAYCSVVGTLMEPGSVPQVATLKLADLSNNTAHQALWSFEVRELQLLLTHDVGLQV